MQFFKRILNLESSSASIMERRGRQRIAVNSKFPLKTVLNVAGRDDRGEILSNSSGGGWDWSGRLINFSESGARIQVPPSVLAVKGDPCQLKLSLEGYELIVPGKISNVKEQYGSILYGLTLQPADDATQNGYQQLVELVALGSTLKPLTKGPIPDESGYLIEQFASDKHSRLVVWREVAGRSVAAFEFSLRDCHVRGATGRELEYLSGASAAAAQPVPTTHTAEVHRLFHWVVPNIATEVPVDVREFLQKYAA